MIPTDTLLTGENAGFLDLTYTAWLSDPGSVDPAWRALFESWERPANGNGHAPAFHPPAPTGRSIFAGSASATARPRLDGADLEIARRQARIVQLINAYRVRGHLVAAIDPLGQRVVPELPELSGSFFGLSEDDLDKPVPSSPVFGEPEISTPRAILKRLKAAYCGSIGAEFMNINDVQVRRWIQERLETLPDRSALDRETELRILRKMCDAESFERAVQTRYPGEKRFSLEGAETLIPMIDSLLTEAAEGGVEEVVIGMAHRGRLNVLANTMDKPIHFILDEFQGIFHENEDGSGDVKYHLGYNSECVTQRGKRILLSLTPNPSHLEAVDPIVEGRVRARQDRRGDADRSKVLPVLLHGDAAFIGQGLVAEVLNFSALRGYATGGTLHLVINNQIGFTTSPVDSRSTPYATDLARMLSVPIFHVNGEDPQAVAAVVHLATEWRQTWGRDAVIDMYCYRKHGHNEGDEPAYTQPLMYEAIRARPTPREIYARRLVTDGHITQADADRVLAESRAEIDRESQPPPESETARGLRNAWAEYDASVHDEIETKVPLDKLKDLLIRANTVPADFGLHPKLQRVMRERMEQIHGERLVDWSIGEQAALATLVVEGYPVRISGQDSGRGTFSHRHAVLTDAKTAAEYVPIQHLPMEVEGKTAQFEVLDSPLSEAGIMGFELGYTWDRPEALVIWEAQFGDFVNGAQIIIDQFLVSAEQKWGRRSGLVLLLPHGYEGQGPEHSSCRIERFLQLCAEDNIQVANCSTPANFFHLLRRQAIRKVRKPLVVATPKSLLRNPVSKMEDLSEGRFHRVLPEIDKEIDPKGVQRVVFCTGKVYFDLEDMRSKMGEKRVAIVRIEQLYPFPGDRVREEIAKYPDGASVVWCQEEPRNMGPWPMLDEWMGEVMPEGRKLQFAGRKPSASPAAGSKKRHDSEKAALLLAALKLPS